MASAAPARGGRARPQLLEDVAALPAANTGLLIFGVMLASLLQVLDITIANVAIPHMQSALGATADSITWVLTSYIIATAVAMPITGWLADRVGARRLFILSTAGFIASSMLCGLAQNLSEMVLFRALQGVSGAFIGPLSQSFMLDSTRPSKHPQMMALWGLGIMIGPIVGPVLGGWLTENWDWRFVFFVNLPVGILALALLVTNLPHRPTRRRRFDVAGFFYIGLTMATLQLMLDRGQQLDWFDSLEIWVYLFLTITGAWLAIVHFVTAKDPLFERELFADRNFVVAVLFMLVVGVVMFAVMALLPPMMQRLLGYGVIDTGMALMPRGVGVLISMQLAGLAVRHHADPRVLVGGGFFIVGLSLWEMAHWSLDVDYSHIWWTGIFQGLGMGFIFIPLQAIAFATLAPRFRTDGSSLLNLMRSIGSSIGISVTTTLLIRSVQMSHEDLASHVTAASSSMFDVSEMDRFQTVGEAALQFGDAMVNRQAAMIGYINDFSFMMWLSFAAIPLVLFMSKPPRR
ncbi:DHA2 family efflux MFS transporter permease subunit [Altererythrobacter salegens]|uniref:DHA2 family efflux MFS transporter permease subunit n=1 Tax=Croceibacterium salegens TaxID=1737568 RepID=A0A6I4SWF6_9SPHN|nr:DHA2 family efflux MFS transporter permease subunit [Croceibacterium salegens]MXO59126.1 DHA2 family efflux MFS transporter permease subunit [Croceibacterium salegens]